VKTLLVIIIVLIPSMAMSWDTKDTYYQGVVIGTLLTDMAQTLYIADNPDRYYEMNPLIGEHPSKEKVIGYFMGGIIAHTAIAIALPPKLRRIWQCVFIVAEAGVISYNFSIGTKLEF
jgi:hypothetical protein